MERQARNRAAQMYHRVNGLIADLAARMEGSKAEMTTAAEALGQALDQLQSALDGDRTSSPRGAATPGPGAGAPGRGRDKIKRQSCQPPVYASSAVPCGRIYI